MGRVCRPVRAINDRMSSRLYRFARYPGSRMADLENKTIASSGASKLLLDRTGQFEINPILFYERSHACVRYCGFETVFNVGCRKGPRSLLCLCRPALGTAYQKQQNTCD